MSLIAGIDADKQCMERVVYDAVHTHVVATSSKSLEFISAGCRRSYARSLQHVDAVRPLYAA